MTSARGGGYGDVYVDDSMQKMSGLDLPMLTEKVKA